MKEKIFLSIMYPTHVEPHKDTIKVKVTPQKAIDLIKSKYKGWLVVIETSSGRFTCTNLKEIKDAKAVYLYHPVGGG